MGLIRDHYAREYRIGWEDEEWGAGILGQSKEDGTGDAPKDRDETDWEHWAACKAVLEMSPKVDHDRVGFYWPDERAVNAALRMVKMAIKQDRPLPEWAQTALAQGWKPPKGWKA